VSARISRRELLEQVGTAGAGIPQAGQSAGVSGTPTIFVIGPNGTQPIVGAQPYAQLKTVIDTALGS